MLSPPEAGIHWLEQAQSDVPAGDHWFSAGELRRLAAFRFANRRDSWRLGRWTAKRVIAGFLEEPCAFPDIEVRADASGGPEAFCCGVRLPLSLSISHRAGVACCAAASAHTRLGCDVELIEPRTPVFVRDYFTEDEQVAIAASRAEDRPEIVTVLWSAKESVLKAARIGLRGDTRSAAVRIDEQPAAANGWARLSAWHEGRSLRGCWRRTRSLVWTFVASWE